MGKLKDKIYRNLKIAALSTLSLFGSSQAKAEGNVAQSPKQNPTEIKADVFDDIIDFEAAEPRFTHQVDTIYGADIGKQVDEGTYEGSTAYYDFDSNTVTKLYFADAKTKPDEEIAKATEVHEEAHKHFANTYGLPIGILSAQQAYCFEFANEFSGYIHETIFQMNESVKADSIIGMHHQANSEFGDLLDEDLGAKYRSSTQEDIEEVLEVMTNSVFKNTYQMMLESPLYEKQLLGAARANSDISGIPDDIRQENYEYAINKAFTITAIDDAGNPVTINLYGYLSDENRELLNTVAPKHRKAVEKIAAENEALIAQNTAKRMARWEQKAAEASAREGMPKEYYLEQYQLEFEDEAREFTFPEQPQYQQHDAEHHVSGVITPQQYDDSFHLAPDYYDYIAAQQNEGGNDIAFAQVRQKLQNLQERKEESPNLGAETASRPVSARTSAVNYAAADNTVER